MKENDAMCPKCDWKPTRGHKYVLDDKVIALLESPVNLHPQRKLDEKEEKIRSIEKKIVSGIEDRTGKLTMIYPILKPVRKRGKYEDYFVEHHRFSGVYRETFEINFCPEHGQYKSKRIERLSYDTRENWIALWKLMAFIGLCLLAVYICAFSGMDVPSRIIWGSILAGIAVNYAIFFIDNIALVFWIPGTVVCIFAVLVWSVFEMDLTARIVVGIVLTAATVLIAVFGTIVRINWEQ